MSKHTKKDIARIQALLGDLDFLFDVQNFTREINLMDNDVDREDKPAADISVDRPYRRLYIRIYPCFFEHTKEEQRKMLLHEFCHTVIEPVQKIARNLYEGKLETGDSLQDAVEGSTSQLENLLDRLLSGKMKWARDAYKEYLK